MTTRLERNEDSAVDGVYHTGKQSFAARGQGKEGTAEKNIKLIQREKYVAVIVQLGSIDDSNALSLGRGEIGSPYSVPKAGRGQGGPLAFWRERAQTACIKVRKKKDCRKNFLRP